MRSFYVGQNPHGSVLFKIVDERKQPVDVMMYYTAKVFIRRPDGSVYSDGYAVPIANPYHAVDYTFGSTSPFTMTGEYQIQIRLNRNSGEPGDKFDYTDIIAIDVIESLEGS